MRTHFALKLLVVGLVATADPAAAQPASSAAPTEINTPAPRAAPTASPTLAHRLGPCEQLSADQAWRCRPPRHLALGVAVLKEYGFGGALRGRFNHVGLEVAGGYMPYLALGGAVRYFTTWQLTSALLVFFNGHHRRTQHGLKLGYAFNTLGGSGFLLGYVCEWSLRRRVAVALGGGIQVYPQAAGRIEDELGGGYRVDKLAGFQPYLGVSVHFYLL